MISELAAYPGGWVQDVTFVVTGGLLAVFGAGLHGAVRAGKGGLAGPALVVASGIGLVVAGAFAVRFEGGSVVEPAAHVAGSVAAFWSAALGHVVLWRRFAADPRWRDRSAVSLATGIAILVAFVVFAGLSVPQEAPLRPWVGIVQRVLVAVWFSGVLVLASRLREVAAGRS